jgi:small subunit ribosomal protein S16
MAVVIRMKRTGRKNRPCYRISATNSRNARDGRTLETLGLYDPASPVESLRLKLEPERVKYWLEHGALPSDTVASILKKQGIAMPSRRQKPARDRAGRKKETQAKAHRSQRKESFAAAKKARRTERLAAKRAAAKAAAAPAEGAS